MIQKKIRYRNALITDFSMIHFSKIYTIIRPALSFGLIIMLLIMVMVLIFITFLCQHHEWITLSIYI